MTSFELVASGLYLVPALVWTIIGRQMWSYQATRHPRSRMIRLVPFVAAVIALHYWVPALSGSIPGTTPADPRETVVRPAHAIHEVTYLAMLAVLRHLLYLSPIPEHRPSRRWLAVNYGIAALTAALGVGRRLSGLTPADQMLGHRIFELGSFVFLVLTVRELVRAARPGVWGPEHAGDLRRSDVAIVCGGVGLAIAIVPVVIVLGWGSLAVVMHEFVLGLAIAAPFALRMLSVVLVEFVVVVTLLATLGSAVVAHVALAPLAGPRFYPLLLFVTVLVLGLIAVPGETWLRTVVHRVLFRRSVRQRASMQEFLRMLSPELGVEECCRRALAELCRVWQLPGAAVLLDDGRNVAQGAFDLEPLARVWPRGDAADRLPARPLGTAELRELPTELREALSAANVGLGAAPLVTPRRRWGFLFLNTGLLGGTVREDEAEALAAFVDQLALLLDGADLLARVVSVERSLAHSGKLAAIGELAARVAHEIRNPVTAARSLAQELARTPGAPNAAEDAAVIVDELDRVERQVRDLLRFARREELRLEAIDLGALVRDATGSLRARLDGVGVRLVLDEDVTVVARGDRDRLRQVVVNLVENAIDALAGAREKAVAIGVGRADGHAVLTVSDTGPGVPPDVLPRLFEPFVSSKPSGTGLGLAIIRRTVDAHGGRIEVSSRPGEGASFRVCLPLSTGA